MKINKDLRQYTAKRIRELRKAAGISQETIAAILNITRTSVSNIETGRQGLTAESILTMCQVFKCTPNDIFPKIDHTNFVVEVEEETVMVPKKKKVFKIIYSNNK